MANWEKLNKEFDDALKSMTDEKWDEFKTRIDKKREEKQALNLQNVSNNEALESSSDGVAVCDCYKYKYSESGKRRWCSNCGREDIGF